MSVVATMSVKAITRAVGAVAILIAVAGWTAPAAASGSFAAAVETILLSQTEGRVATLSAEKKHELIACVNQVLTAMPNGMKRFVLAAANFDEMEHRFGEVVMQNRAEWKQKIARGCAHIVV